MTNILYTYENDMPTVSIIRQSVMTYARTEGRAYRFKQILSVTKEDLLWCDAVFMIRPNDPYSAHLAKLANRSGCFVVAYYDDDLYDLPASMPNPSWRRKSILNTLSYTNVVESTSHYICGKYKKYTFQNRESVSGTVVHPKDINYIPEQEDGAQTSPVKLIYAAGAGHVVFFNEYILPIMPKLCERYGRKISMTFMGVHPDLTEFSSQMDIQYFDTMPLKEYRRAIAEGAYDIGLSPLPGDEFTKCKYFNKFIEYTMAGFMGVYSNTEPYTYVVRDGINGLLADNDSQSWFDTLCRAIDDGLLRNRCVREAQRQLIREFSLEVNIKRRQAEMPELYRKRTKTDPVGGFALQKLLYKVVRMMDRIHQVLFYFRRIGLTGLIRKIKEHFRERNVFNG